MLMNIEQIRNVKRIKELAELANNDSIAFEGIFFGIKSTNERIAYNSSWAAAHLTEKNSKCDIFRFFPILIEVASTTVKGGIKRNIIKILQQIPIPVEFQYDCADLALNALLNKNDDVAVRAFALTILEHLIVNIPELIEEVLFLIEKEKSFANAAFIVRSNRFEKTAKKYLGANN